MDEEQENLPPIGTAAYTAFMMAKLFPPEEEGLPHDFWDQWKEEMKEGM